MMIINAKIRKYLAIFLSVTILSLIVWAVLIIISGREEGLKDPVKIYKKASQNIENLNDFSLIYNTEYSAILDEESSSLTSTTKLLKKGNRFKAHEKDDRNTETIYFYDKEQNLAIRCSTLYPENCQKLDSPLLVPNLDPQEYIEISEKWIQKGVISLEYLGEKKISNRNCYEVQSNYDIEKLQEEIERLIGPGQNQGSLLSLDFIMCIDKEFGLPLQIIHNSEQVLFNKKLEISFTSTFSDLDLSSKILEEDLELPLPINLNLDLTNIEGLGIYDPWFGQIAIGTNSGKLDTVAEVDFRKIEGRVYRINIQASDCIKKLSGSLKSKILMDFDDIVSKINKGIKYIGKENCVFNSSVEIVDNFISPPSYLPDEIGTYGMVDVRTSMGNGIRLFVDFYNLNPKGNQVSPGWPRPLMGYVYFWEDFKETCYKISFDNNEWIFVRDKLKKINEEYCK